MDYYIGGHGAGDITELVKDSYLIGTKVYAFNVMDRSAQFQLLSLRLPLPNHGWPILAPFDF
jgi:hypothetical protein